MPCCFYGLYTFISLYITPILSSESPNLQVFQNLCEIMCISTMNKLEHYISPLTILKVVDKVAYMFEIYTHKHK